MKNIRHIGIVTRDIEESLDFYKVMGFKKTLDNQEYNPLYGGIIHVIKMKHRRAKILLELIEPKNEVCMQDWHFAISVDSVKNAKEEYERCYPWKPGVAFIRAHEGTMIELVSEKELE
jgi:catechol 2,3-dioxygenase-like lactoylglutathione lyase family enzyme